LIWRFLYFTFERKVNKLSTFCLIFKYLIAPLFQQFPPSGAPVKQPESIIRRDLKADFKLIKTGEDLAIGKTHQSEILNW
jgi:hypothetical protein